MIGVMSDTDERGSRAARQEERRKEASRLLREGWKPEQVARIVGRSRSWVFGVQKTVRERGEEALDSKPRPVGPTKLDTARRRELAVLIKDFTPRDFGFDQVLWTRRIIGDLIFQRWGVDVSPPTVGNILREIGFTPQRPVRRAIEQDPERVARWEKEDFPEIRERMEEEGAELYFGDEAGVRGDYHSGTTWAPVGRTPVVRTTGKRTSVSMLSAISLNGDISFEVKTGTVDSQAFIAFCLKLMSDVGNKKVFLIIDNAGYHVSRATSEFVENTGGRLTLFFLPPYSPELNPDELVWKNVKHDQIGRSSIRNGFELRSRAIAALESLRELPEIITGFFRAPRLAYITR